MCGIVGYTGTEEATPFLLEGLATLEYRGYDSAGVEVLGTDGTLHGVKCAGRVATLVERCEQANLVGTCGIAHTRWATHGAPSDRNAHPHRSCKGDIALVHNGIIENFRELREELTANGHELASDTDSEVIVHLIEESMEGPAAGDLLEATRIAVSRLEGSWAVAVVSARQPGVMVCARRNSPLVLTSTEDGAYCASDITAIIGKSRHITQLQDGQLARLTPDGAIQVIDAEGREVAEPTTIDVNWSASEAKRGGYPDFMSKEVAEQPEAIERLLANRLGESGIALDELNMTDDEIAAIDRIYVIACGTSYHVGLIAKDIIEGWAKIPVSVEIASEFSYANVLATENTLCVVITQSGETADTLASARRMKAMGCRVFSICNVIGCTAAREADGTIYVQAGPEICVASTKAYTSQMTAAFLFALYLAHHTGRMTLDEVRAKYEALCEVPDAVREVLDRSWQDRDAARLFEGWNSSLFLGRGINSTTAMEGALKLKELSYLHAEAYAAGEMKHGSISLVEDGYPIVAVVPDDSTRAKMLSNIQEVKARGAAVVAVATDGDEDVAAQCDKVLWVPRLTEEAMVAIPAVVHLQLLARFVSVDRDRDVDKPRNLAKSVTVE